MSEQAGDWSPLITGWRAKHWLGITMGRVAHSLTDMVGRTISNTPPHVETLPITQVAARFGDPGAKVVGIYLQIEGDLRGRALLILPMSSALDLIDRLMDAPAGTTTRVGLEERSALAEVGNLTLSCFLNAVASLTEMPKRLRPSPPAVMVDVLGAILNLVVAPVALRSDEVLIVETVLRDATGKLEVRFCVFPDTTS
jgi:chemotaxis protein CheC